MKESIEANFVPGDNPILDVESDLFERAQVANAFAEQVLGLDSTEGVTVGVFGPWGSGKTSFVNLARQTFQRADVPILDFNPWLFSGTEQLVQRFFAEVSAGMGMNDELKDIGEAFNRYGAAFNSMAGAASAHLGDLGKQSLERIAEEVRVKQAILIHANETRVEE